MPKKLLNAPTLVGAGLGGATGLAINRLALGNKSILSNLLATAAGGALGGIAGHYINKNITDTVAQNEVRAAKEKAEKEEKLAKNKAAANAKGVVGKATATLASSLESAVGTDNYNKTVDKLTNFIVKADEAAAQVERTKEEVKKAVDTGATALNQTVAKSPEVSPAVKEIIAPENIAAGVAAVGGGVVSNKAKDWIRKKTETQKGDNKETPKGLTKETPFSTDIKVGEYKLAPHKQPVTMTMDQFGKVKLQVDGRDVTRQDILGMSPDRGAAKTALREIGSQVEKRKQANKIIKTQKVEVVPKPDKPIITLDGLHIQPNQLTPEEQDKAITVINEMNEAVKATRGKKGGKAKLSKEHIANRETPTGGYKPIEKPKGVDVSVILPGLEEKKVSYSLTENGVPEVKIDGKPVNVMALDSKTRKALLREMVRDPRVKTNPFKLFWFGNSGEKQFMDRLKDSIPLKTRLGMGLKNSIKVLAKGTTKGAVKAGGSSLVHAGLSGWLAREATKSLKDQLNNFVGNYFENYARAANAKKAPEIERRMRLEEQLRRARQNSK